MWLQLATQGKLHALLNKTNQKRIALCGIITLDAPKSIVLRTLLDSNCGAVGSTFVDLSGVRILQRVNDKNRLIIKPVHSTLTSAGVQVPPNMCIYQALHAEVNDYFQLSHALFSRLGLSLSPYALTFYSAPMNAIPIYSGFPNRNV